jgi:DNA-binding LytR/AlgR family response regulator
MKNSCYYIFLTSLLFLTFGFSQSKGNTEIDSLLKKSNSFYNTNQDSALYYSKTAYSKAIETKDTSNICRVITFYSKNLMSKKLYKASETLLLFNITNKKYLSKRSLGITYFNLGAIHQIKEERDLALENYLNALGVFSEINDHKYLANTYLYIGVVIQKGDKKNKEKEADYFYSKSLFHSKLDKNKSNSSQEPLHKLGEIALETKVKTCKDALAGIVNPNHSKIAAIIYYDLSKNYFIEHYFKEAIEYAKKSIEIKNNINFPQNIDYSYFVIGKSLLALEKYEKAIETLQKVLVVSKKRALRVSTLQALVVAYKNNDDIHSALEISEKLLTVKDSINQFRENEKMAEITTKFENEKQAKDILTLEKANQEKNLLLLSQENRWWRLTALAITLMLIVFWLIKRYLNSLKKVKEIEQEKIFLAKKVETKFIVLNNKNKVYLKDLKYIKASGNYLEFYTVDKTIIDRNKIKIIIELLPPNFLKTHRSYVVNKNYIVSVNTTTVIIKPDVETPLSRTFKGALN